MIKKIQRIEVWRAKLEYWKSPGFIWKYGMLGELLCKKSGV
jgi:hypothetical protein